MFRLRLLRSFAPRSRRLASSRLTLLVRSQLASADVDENTKRSISVPNELPQDYLNNLTSVRLCVLWTQSLVFMPQRSAVPEMQRGRGGRYGRSGSGYGRSGGGGAYGSYRDRDRAGGS